MDKRVWGGLYHSKISADRQESVDTLRPLPAATTRLWCIPIWSGGRCVPCHTDRRRETHRVCFSNIEQSRKELSTNREGSIEHRFWNENVPYLPVREEVHFADGPPSPDIHLCSVYRSTDPGSKPDPALGVAPQYRRSWAHANADGLSRLPLLDRPKSSEHSIFYFEMVESAPVTACQVKKETKGDPILSRVFDHVMRGDMSHVAQAPPELQPYLSRVKELTVTAGCLLWGMHVIIPQKLREPVLRELHSGHCGIVRMEDLAHS